MSKFFEYDDKPQWFYIRARCTDIFKPDGKVINFYLLGDSELFIRELLGKKGYKDIEWIKPIGDTLPFV